MRPAACIRASGSSASKLGHSSPVSVLVLQIQSGLLQRSPLLHPAVLVLLPSEQLDPLPGLIRLSRLLSAILLPAAILLLRAPLAHHPLRNRKPAAHRSSLRPRVKHPHLGELREGDDKIQVAGFCSEFARCSGAKQLQAHHLRAAADA